MGGGWNGRMVCGFPVLIRVLRHTFKGSDESRLWLLYLHFTSTCCSRVTAFREEPTILFNSLHCVLLHSISYVRRYGLLNTYALLFHTISYKPGNGACTTGRSFARRAKISRICDPKCVHRMQEETYKGRDSVYVQLKVY